MNTVKFNNLLMPIESYNKSTYFDNGSIVSNGTCSVVVSDMTALNAVAVAGVTSIEIYHDDNLIYSLHDINCRITNISEYLGEDKMNISLSLVFDMEENS